MQSLLQTDIWADFKSTQGWRALRIGELSVLERPILWGKTFAYSPEVNIENLNKSLLLQLSKEVNISCPQAICFRLEIFQSVDDHKNVINSLKEAGYQKAFEAVQPEQRQWIDIRPSEEEILQAMKEKGRYNVRLAEKKGVKVRVSTDTKDIEVFYQLFMETAKRDGFQIRSKQYFINLFEALIKNNQAELIIAEFNNEPLCALIITYFDGLASYLYGASSNRQRNLMAPYLAHLGAIRSAKEHNCHTYDLLQIGQIDSLTGEIIGRYANLTRFKQQFGGRSIDLIGSYDYIYQPIAYKIFALAQRLRRH